MYFLYYALYCCAKQGHVLLVLIIHKNFSYKRRKNQKQNHEWTVSRRHHTSLIMFCSSASVEDHVICFVLVFVNNIIQSTLAKKQ